VFVVLASVSLAPSCAGRAISNDKEDDPTSADDDAPPSGGSGGANGSKGASGGTNAGGKGGASAGGEGGANTGGDVGGTETGGTGDVGGGGSRAGGNQGGTGLLAGAGGMPRGGASSGGGAAGANAMGGNSTAGNAGNAGAAGANMDPECLGISRDTPCAPDGKLCQNLACGLAKSGRRACACMTNWSCLSCDFTNSQFRDRPATVLPCENGVADEVSCTRENTVCGPQPSGEYCACWTSPADGLSWDCDDPPSTWPEGAR
jgi:hypothetical protein